MSIQPQCRKTTMDELYTTLVNLVAKVTARPVWRKMGLQAAPRGPYATVLLTEGPSPVQDVIEEIELDAGGFVQAPVGLTRLECRVEFFRNVAVQSALEATVRFRQSLQLDSRFDDIWRISGLVGEIRMIDVSTMFRGNVDGRAELRFGLYADIGATAITTDPNVGQIDHETINVYRDNANTTPVAQIQVNSEA
jgi:hypothetical protein